uniref:Uncharacterized protein n=1 Tax=Ditylenchus dipsaci TaxID=166011 RepID=A0A915DHD7_9BILA
MNRLSMDLSELSLDGPPCNFDEETWLTGDGLYENTGGDEEDLNKWLAGAVKKVDFRTRSALTRRLDKKKQKHENKDRTKSKMDTLLDMIEEVSNESNSERDKQRDRGLSPKIRVQQKQQNIVQSSMKASYSDCTDSFVEDEDDLFYDAASEQPQIHRTAESFVTPSEHHHTAQSSAASTKANHDGPKLSVGSMTTPRRNGPATRSLRKSYSHFEEGQTNGSNALFSSPQHMNMTELERRAKEQEQELKMELMSYMQHDRLYPRSNGDTASQHSRPNSSSSNSSANPVIATSKSVDFRSVASSVNSEMSSSRSNDGSISDLSKLDNRPMFNSRLPLPRRPGIPGRTGIPLPTPKSSVQSRRNTPNGATTPTPSQQTSSRYVNFDDDECF